MSDAPDSMAMFWILTTGIITLTLLLSTRRAKRIFAPPHGRIRLAAVWVISIIAVLYGFLGYPPFGLMMACLGIAPVLAVTSTLAYHDATRKSHGLPRAVHVFPENLSPLGRIGFAMAALLAAYFGVSTFNSESLHGISTTLGAALFFGWFSYGAITARVPATMRRYLGGVRSTRTADDAQIADHQSTSQQKDGH